MESHQPFYFFALHIGAGVLSNNSKKKKLYIKTMKDVCEEARSMLIKGASSEVSVFAAIKALEVSVHFN